MIADATIRIETKNSVLEFRSDERGRLHQTHYGGREAKPGEPRWAYPPAGDGWVFEPAIRLIHADGNTSTNLRVENWDQEGCETRIRLIDPAYAVTVDLLFRTVAEHDVIEAWTVVQNKESGTVVVDAAAAASLSLSPAEYWVTQFHGDWADEVNMVEERLTPGIKVFDSKLAVRAHQFRAPWFLLAKGAPVHEDSGEVIAGSLAWSGSFRFAFEVLPKIGLSVLAGSNPYAGSFRLAPGESLESPRMVWAWSGNGKGDLSRKLHRYVRERILRDGDRPRAVLLNNWEATYFKFDETKIVSLIAGAKALGMELFLLDDGWFGSKYPRNDDTQGLGDWMVDAKKLPNGVKALTDAAERNDIRFGLWFEPEMVNPRSELFEAHPEWAIQQPKRPLEVQRNQMVLDLSNPEARAYALSILDDALRANPGISFVKWDCNRYLTQPGSRYLPPDRQEELAFRYVRALYEIMDEVAKRHPDVEIMVCSGGGGRVDFGAMSYAHEFWASDMTDPVRRIFIQWGFSHMFPAISVACHVTRWGERPLKFAFDVAMSGRLGMDVDVDRLSESDREFARRAISTYKEIRPIVQFGEQYRLESPYEGVRSGMMYVKDEDAVVFAFSLGDASASPMRLAGLDPAKRYTIREINRRDGVEGSATSRSGRELMESGLPISSLNKHESQILRLAGG